MKSLSGKALSESSDDFVQLLGDAPRFRGGRLSNGASAISSEPSRRQRRHHFSQALCTERSATHVETWVDAATFAPCRAFGPKLSVPRAGRSAAGLRLIARTELRPKWLIDVS